MNLKRFDKLTTKEAVEDFFNEFEGEDTVELFYYDIEYHKYVQIWLDYDSSLHFHFYNEDCEKYHNRIVEEYIEIYTEEDAAKLKKKLITKLRYDLED